jgi:hypothetical protein
MRLVDALLRQGHLSERALVDALMTGDRPLHLDRCDICADRAVEMNRWLDAVKSAAVDAADDVFPPERLAAQQAQILRRLEQLDEPARVIAFPRQPRLDHRDTERRRVAPAWVGVAAAAGLVIGVIGGQFSARLATPVASPAAAPTTQTIAAPEPEAVAADTSWLERDDVDGFIPASLDALNVLTPRVVMASTIR